MAESSCSSVETDGSWRSQIMLPIAMEALRTRGHLAMRNGGTWGRENFRVQTIDALCRRGYAWCDEVGAYPTKKGMEAKVRGEL